MVFVGETPFQFQLGAIGSSEVFTFTLEVKHVSIPAWCDWERLIKLKSAITISCFNSSLVRLGASMANVVKLKFVEFQFQLGAIGSARNLGIAFQDTAFQFQLGAIGSSKVA